MASVDLRLCSYIPRLLSRAAERQNAAAGGILWMVWLTSATGVIGTTTYASLGLRGVY